jgi:hypothetical protein
MQFSYKLLYENMWLNFKKEGQNSVITHIEEENHKCRDSKASLYKLLLSYQGRSGSTASK